MFIPKEYFIFIFSFFLSNKLINLFIAKFKKKFIDIPNLRSMHTNPKPRGLGIIFAFLTVFSSCIYLYFDGISSKNLIPLICFPMALIGILDDLFSIPSPIKYFIHLVTSILILSSCNLLLDQNFKNNLFLIFISSLIILLFTAIINFINFMDGIDGLVGGCLFVAILTSCIVLGVGQSYYVLLGSLFSFIFFNWPPALGFMGDTGSTFLAGIYVGMISLSNSLYDAFGLILILGPCLIDPFVCVIRRFSHQQNIFTAHRLHLYQRLRLAGIKESTVSTIYIIATLFLSLSLIYFGLLCTFIIFIITFIIGYYLDQFIAVPFDYSLKNKTFL